MITVEITGCEDMAQIAEALELVGATATLARPATSYEDDPRWKKMPPTGSQRQAVLLALARVGEASRDTLADLLAIPDSAVDGRVIELRGGGYITDTGARELTRAGRPAEVLCLTEDARRKLRCVVTSWYPNGERTPGF